MIKTTLFSLLGAGVIISAFLTYDFSKPASRAVAAPTVNQSEAAALPAPVAEPETVALKVEGMTCGGCAIAARTVLTRLDGVEKAEVSYEKRSAVVTYDSEKVNPDQMIQALAEELRYKATVVTS